jgi:hypothetical protein
MNKPVENSQIVKDLTEQRNLYKAKYRSIITLLRRARSEIREISDHTENEGDRVYFGSTNHADQLQDLAETMQRWEFDYDLPAGDLNKMERDPYAEIRAQRKLVAKAREDVKRLEVELQGALLRIEKLKTVVRASAVELLAMAKHAGPEADALFYRGVAAAADTLDITFRRHMAGETPSELAAELLMDKARLDFLDECNRRLNASCGTRYGWDMVMNHNVTRLMSGRHLDIDLNDSKAHGAPSCRDAIDKEIKRIADARMRQEANGNGTDHAG